MTLNIENLVRSGVVLAVGLPFALSVGGLTNTFADLAKQAASDPTAETTNPLKAELAAPCVRYLLSKSDSKLEREAKNAIDEVMGGPVSYGDTCNWAL